MFDIAIKIIQYKEPIIDDLWQNPYPKMNRLLNSLCIYEQIEFLYSYLLS